MTTQTASGTPWYHHSWPWFIVVLMVVSVGASLSTVYIAYVNRDVEIERTEIEPSLRPERDVGG